MSSITERLAELDKRHADLLERLSALDAEVAHILREWLQMKSEAKDTSAEA